MHGRAGVLAGSKSLCVRLIAFLFVVQGYGNDLCLFEEQDNIRCICPSIARLFVDERGSYRDRFSCLALVIYAAKVDCNGLEVDVGGVG